MPDLTTDLTICHHHHHYRGHQVVTGGLALGFLLLILRQLSLLSSPLSSKHCVNTCGHLHHPQHIVLLCQDTRVWQPAAHTVYQGCRASGAGKEFRTVLVNTECIAGVPA